MQWRPIVLVFSGVSLVLLIFLVLRPVSPKQIMPPDAIYFVPGRDTKSSTPSNKYTESNNDKVYRKLQEKPLAKNDINPTSDDSILNQTVIGKELLNKFNNENRNSDWATAEENGIKSIASKLSYIRHDETNSENCKSSLCKMTFSIQSNISLENKKVAFDALQNSKFMEDLKKLGLNPQTASFVSNGESERVVMIYGK